MWDAPGCPSASNSDLVFVGTLLRHSAPGRAAFYRVDKWIERPGDRKLGVEDIKSYLQPDLEKELTELTEKITECFICQLSLEIFRALIAV